MSHDLEGIVILNTRPTFLGANQRFAKLIESHGGKTYSLPLQTIIPIDFSIPTLLTYNTIIFVSQAAVHCFFKKIKTAFPTTLSVVAIGKATADAIKEHNIQVTSYAEDASSENLLMSPLFQESNGQTILWVKGTQGREVIGHELKKRGAQVTELIVYDSQVQKLRPEELECIWANKKINMVLITSEQAFKHLLSLAPLDWLIKKDVLCFSKRLADIAKEVIQGHILISRHDQILKTLLHFKAQHE